MMKQIIPAFSTRPSKAGLNGTTYPFNSLLFILFGGGFFY